MCLNGRPYVMTGLTASDNLNIWKLVPNIRRVLCSTFRKKLFFKKELDR
jgi:hypothetical protein